MEVFADKCDTNSRMNCLLEAMASVWMGMRRSVMTEPPEEEVMTAQEGLEQCRRNMEGRERELQVDLLFVLVSVWSRY
jgi:hypothetical protein